MRQINLSFDNEQFLSGQNLKNPPILTDFPFDKAYEAAKKEASRKKPLFFIHRYFARRTTINFRLLLLSFLLAPTDEVWSKFYTAQKIRNDEEISILDPFMGGGTTVFEALRLGAQVIGNDLQPLSKLITYGEVAQAPLAKIKKELQHLREETGGYLKSFYKTTCPRCGDQADVMYNFWVKTSPAPDESSDHHHDLYSSFVLAHNKGTFTMVCPDCLEVFKTTFSPEGAACPKCGHKFASPQDSYVVKGKFTCGKCTYTANVRDMLSSAREPLPTKLIAQEFYCPHCQAHDYKSIADEDLELYQSAVIEYERLKETLPLPRQVIPAGFNTRQMINHGYHRFSQMFNTRQLLCLGSLLKTIDHLPDEEVRPWLLLAFSASLEMNNMFCRYQSNAFKICNIFFNHAYVPINMPVENNVWGTKLGTGTFEKAVQKLIKAKEFNENIYDIAVVKGNSTKVSSPDKVLTQPADKWEELKRTQPLLTCRDSRDLQHIPDAGIDLVITDPPFGNNLMYAELIDFFHVWLNSSVTGRALGFSLPYSPKDNEIVVNPAQNKTYQDYSSSLGEVFQECNRVLKKDGYLAFSFHENSIQGWLSVIRALKNSGFNLRAAYPVHAESRTGAHTSKKESIVFDVFLVCQKTTSSAVSSFDLPEILTKGFYQAEKIIKRLVDINAELTVPDLENICLAQVFTSLDSVGALTTLSWEEISSLAEKIVSKIHLRIEVSTVKKRTGWWSEMHKLINGQNRG